MAGDNQTISEVKYLWTDGEDIYYYPTGQYVYKLVSIENQYITLETITKTAIGLPDSPWDTIGTNIWYNPLDDTIYYLDTYIWNKSTKTWSSVTKRFSDIASFEPQSIFTDGNFLFYIINSSPTPTIYRLTYDGYSYGSFTVNFSNVPTSVNRLGFWTDGINLYYSDHSGYYIDGDWLVNTNNATFTSITWEDNNSYTLTINGDEIWSNGDDVYWDNGTNNHYKLNKSTNKWIWINRDSGGNGISAKNIFLGPDNYYYKIEDWSPNNWTQLQYKYNPKVKPM